MNIKTKFTPPEEQLNWLNMMGYLDSFDKGGSINIKPQNRGKFTAYADSKGMSVQQAASSVLNNPNASDTLRKRAQFARNASHFKHDYGGVIETGGDPSNGPIVTVQPGDPTFQNEAEFTKYYRQKAEQVLQQNDPEFYQNYQAAMAEGNDLKAQSYLAARGGLPRFVAPPKMKDVPYSNYAPDRTTLKDYIKGIRDRSIEAKQYNQEIKRKEQAGLALQNQNALSLNRRP